MIWKNIRGRCNNPRDQRYSDYGGRGITICPQWNDFEQFLTDVGKRPSPNHSLERIHNDKGYSPENCKWATRHEQNNNKRSNRSITFQGRTQNLEQWVQELRISKHVFYRALLLGASNADALAFAVERKGKNTPIHSFPRLSKYS